MCPHVRFVEHIESLYTKIFLMVLNFNIIGGSLAGIQVCINFSFYITNNFRADDNFCYIFQRKI